MTRIILLALLGLTAPAAWADSIITTTNARAFETTPSAMAGGGFLDVTNTGTTDDRLIGVVGDFARVEVHTTEFTDGIARMMQMDSVPIPAGETVTLAPGGMHVMFMGLRGDPFEIGETVQATLIFEIAGQVPVSFEVIKRDTAAQNH